MKENYVSPQLTLITFVPDAKIASFDFDDVQNGIFKDEDLNEGSDPIDTNGL